MRKTLISIILLVLFLISTPVLASDVSSAKYLTIISIDNTGTALTNQAVVFTKSTADMIAADFLNATATDAAMLTGSGGTDLKFMPGWSTNPWVTWVNSIGQDANLQEYLYHKGATGGGNSLFPRNWRHDNIR